MVTYSSILPPSSLGAAARPLKDFSATEFEAVVAAVTGPRSFSLKKEELEELRGRVAPHAQNITYFLAALSFLYNHVWRLVEAGMPYRDAIAGVVDELDSDAEWGGKKAEVIERLLRLFEPETHQRRRKLQRLQSGFIPNAVGFSTLVDLRPDFGPTEELSLRGYLSVIQFRVTTDSDNEVAKRIVFQVTESTLAELKKAVERAEAKLALLKKQSLVSSEIVSL